jgi:CobQ-like glutamine amidotransferase family enzyme
MATALVQDFVTSRDHISRVPQLQGASNYQQWATAICGPLQMLGGWKIVTGEMLHAT